MLTMLKMLPLLILETAPKAEEKNDDPDFFGVFSKMQETLDAINTKLTPAEVATPVVPETPATPEVPPESETLETPASQHKEAPKETEEVKVETPEKPKGKAYPWKAAR